MQRLEQLTSFEKIYAPFNGVLTSRSIDVGQLIDQGARPNELFHMASTDVLRVYINVPQIYSRDAPPGTKAELHFPSTRAARSKARWSALPNPSTPTRARCWWKSTLTTARAI